MEFLWAIITFFATFGAAIFIGHLVAGPARAPRMRLRSLAQPTEAPPPPPKEEKSPRKDMLPTVSRILTGRQLTENLYLELSSAGLMMRPSEFVGLTLAVVAFFQAVAVLIGRGPVGHLLMALIGAALPVVVLRSLQQRRRAAFERQIVDALMMISSSLRSGFSFFKAMQIVAQEMPPPISTEFERVINETSVGKPLEDALKDVVARVKSYEFDLVVITVLIQLQVGGNLASLLETTAQTIRERVRILGELNALTAEGRISGVVLVALPILLAVFLSTANPSYMQILMIEPLGRIMVVGAIIMQILGALVIRKMLDLEV